MDIPENYKYLFKFLIIGASGSGKTCILRRYTEGKFIPNMPHTIGAEFGSKIINVDGTTVKIQIWDTAGQERFHTITSSYYRGAMGIMLIYDITSRQTFDNVQTWMNRTFSLASNEVEKLLIANKCDMAHNRVVSYEEGRQKAEEYGIGFLETSAKSSTNVHKAFEELTRAILHNSSIRRHESSTVTQVHRLAEPPNSISGTCCSTG